MSRSAWLLLLLVVACGGKVNVAHRDALRDADQAIKRGDAVGAARAFRAACQAQPDDKRSCEMARLYTRGAIDERLALARPRCEPPEGKVDVDGCLAALAPARSLEPADPELIRLADVAGRAHTERCLNSPPQKPDEAVALTRCMLSQRAQVATADYERRLRGALARAASVFVDLAARDSTRGLPGAQAVLWAAAGCLDADGEVRRRAQVSRTDFVSAFAVPIEMVVTVSGGTLTPALAAVCTRAAGVLGERATCATGSKQAAIGVNVALALGQPEHRISEETRTTRWQTGVDRRENPAHRAAQERVRLADEGFRGVEQDTLDREARCSAAKSALDRAQQCSACAERENMERSCAEADGARQVFDRRRRELDDARAELSRTTPVLEEPIFQDFRYVVRKHAWTLRWTAELALAGGATVQASGALSVEDEEHAGHSPSGLGADPLSPPPGNWFEAGVAGAVGARVADVVSGELARRANARRGECVGDAPVWTGAWLECWAEATLWSGAGVDGLALLTGTAHASDKFKPAGASWPAPQCLP